MNGVAMEQRVCRMQRRVSTQSRHEHESSYESRSHSRAQKYRDILEILEDIPDF